MPTSNYTARAVIDYGGLLPIDGDIQLIHSTQKVSPMINDKLYKATNIIPVKTTWLERNWTWIILVIKVLGVGIILYYTYKSEDSDLQISTTPIKDEKKTT